MTNSKDEYLGEFGAATVPREIWFQSKGVPLYAIELGSGPPIVLLHGGLADHRAALLGIASLAASRRVLTPDLRGSGRSVHAGELSWDQLADDVEALLSHVGLESAVVGGTSMGTAVALRFALRHPQRAAGLVLMAPVYAGQDRGLTAAQSAAFRAMDEAGRRTLDQGIAALRPLFERLPLPIRERAMEMMLSFDPASVAATTRFLVSGEQPFGSADELAAIEAPVVLVPGTDAEHPPEISELYARHLRRSVVVDPSTTELAEQVVQFLSPNSRSHTV